MRNKLAVALQISCQTAQKPVKKYKECSEEIKSQRINERIFVSKFTVEALKEATVPEPCFIRDVPKDLIHTKMSAKKLMNKSTKHTQANQQAHITFTPES